MRYIIMPLICIVLLSAACSPSPATSPPAAPVPPTSADAALSIPPTTVPPPAPLDLPELRADARLPIAAPTPKATPVPGDPVRIVIDTIGMDRPMVGVGLDSNYIPIVPKHDVGWYFYSAQPGSGENVVLWGHVLRFLDAPDIGAPFARMHEVPIGATITLYNDQGNAYTYVVREQVWALPNEVDYILPRGEELLTLVSCIGDKVIVDDHVQMTHRLITIAEPQGT
ncbi:MAG: class F sortase [Chloroflexaceae bacterium]|nr:class F sortase [Chloroflexaceae bacterium]